MTELIIRVSINNRNGLSYLDLERVVPGHNANEITSFILTDKEFSYFEGPNQANNTDVRGYLFKNDDEAAYDQNKMIYVERHPGGNQDDDFYMQNVEQTPQGQFLDRKGLHIIRAAADDFIELMNASVRPSQEPADVVPSLPSSQHQENDMGDAAGGYAGAATGATSGATGYTPGNSQEPHRKSRKGRKERKGRKSRKGRKERKSRKSRKSRKERKERKERKL
jgi:hypothetical protein